MNAPQMPAVRPHVRQGAPVWTAASKGEADAAAAAGVDYWDTNLWYCSSLGYCPSFVGTTPVRSDGLHLTLEYAATLTPVFAEMFAETMAN